MKKKLLNWTVFDNACNLNAKQLCEHKCHRVTKQFVKNVKNRFWHFDTIRQSKQLMVLVLQGYETKP